MKSRSRLLLSLILCCLSAAIPSAFAQGTAFTYQGQLLENGAPASGSYDLRFIVYDNGVGGGQQGPVLTNSAVAVNNGLFTATLDFGNQFPGAGRWLEIAVRTNGGGAFTTLASRQSLTPAPYAITSANLSGALPASQLSGNVPGSLLSGAYSNALTFNNAADQFTGSFAGDGANVTNVNAATLNGSSAGNFWQLGGNTVSSGQFLGSANNQPLELKVNGQRSLRLEPNTNGGPNVIGGSPANFIAPGEVGCTIAGGGALNYSGMTHSNTIFGNYFCTIGGGLDNTAYGSVSTVCGGWGNYCFGPYSTISGGIYNNANGYAAMVAGGQSNTAGGGFSFAAGRNAQAMSQGAFVWADSQLATFTSTASDQFLIRAQGGVGIGLNNPTSPLHVASTSTGTPQVQITQNNSSDSVRLRMNVNSYLGWEMDVTSGSSPQFQFWYVGAAGPRMTIDTSGNVFAAGNVTANGVLLTSDRNAKEHFAALDPQSVLARVAALPVTEWNYRDDPERKHVGPMAQDFHAAFGLDGTDDKHISVVDEGGVALAAIQGLNQKLQAELAAQKQWAEAKNADIAALKAKNDALEKRLEALERLLPRETAQAGATRGPGE